MNCLVCDGTGIYDTEALINCTRCGTGDVVGSGVEPQGPITPDSPISEPEEVI